MESAREMVILFTLRLGLLADLDDLRIEGSIDLGAHLKSVSQEAG